MKKLDLVRCAADCGSLLVWFGATRRTSRTATYSLTLQEANKNKILLLTVGSEPRTLDPQEAQGVTEHHIIMAMIEGLVAPSIDDQSKAVPGMADRWEHNDDYSVWTFHIGDDRKWSNGDPVTADDFVKSYRRILTPTLGAKYSYMLYPMKNAKAFNEGKITDPTQLGVRAVDARTLELTLDCPTSYLLEFHGESLHLVGCPHAHGGKIWRPLQAGEPVDAAGKLRR